MARVWGYKNTFKKCALQMKEIFFYFFFSFHFLLLLSSSHFHPFYIQNGCGSPIVVVNGCSLSFIIWQIKPYGTEVKYCIRKFLFHHFQWSRFVSLRFVYFVWLLFYSVFPFRCWVKIWNAFLLLSVGHFNMVFEFGCNTHSHTHMVLSYYIFESNFEW